MSRWILLIGLLVASITTVPALAQILVVRPSDWAEAAADWTEHRRAEGFHIVELEAGESATETRTAIQAAWNKLSSKGNTPPYIVLMGDVPAQSDQRDDRAGRQAIPTFYVESQVVKQFGSEPTIATDQPYADWNDDGVCEAVVGRIPAASKEALARYLSRVVEYERSKIDASRLREIDVVAGVGDFGIVADTIIEGVTRQLLTSDLPESYRLSMTQASSKSIYCPAPAVFQKSVLDRLNDGGLFWVYLGHGFIDTLDHLKFTKPKQPILDARSIERMAIRHTPPIAVILACYVGAYDAKVPSLAERMLLEVDGPIAVVAASRVTMPYAMGVFGDELLKNCFVERTDRVGRLFSAAKTGLAKPSVDASSPSTSTERSALVSGAASSPRIRIPSTEVDRTDDSTKRDLMDAMAKALSPEGHSLDAERREHLYLFNLLGDPLLMVRQPDSIEFETKECISVGEPVVIRGSVNSPGRLRAELCFRRSRTPDSIRTIRADPTITNAGQKQQAIYEAANQLEIKALEKDVTSGNFAVELPPDSLRPGTYSINVAWEGDQAWALGNKTIRVEPAK